MAHRSDLAIGQLVVTRWRLLAERRLIYLLELRDSGRWRRYYTEASLAENILETEAAVAAWRQLAPVETANAAREASPGSVIWMAPTLTPPSAPRQAHGHGGVTPIQQRVASFGGSR